MPFSIGKMHASGWMWVGLYKTDTKSDLRPGKKAMSSNYTSFRVHLEGTLQSWDKQVSTNRWHFTFFIFCIEEVWNDQDSSYSFATGHTEQSGEKGLGKRDDQELDGHSGGKAPRVLRVLFCKIHMSFTEEKLPSGHSAIKPRSMECCSDGCPSGSWSHLHTGCQNDHWALGHLSYQGPSSLIVQFGCLVWLGVQL